MLKNWLFYIFLIITIPALAKSTLVVYTDNSFNSEWDPRSLTKKAFESKYNCKLKFIALGDSITLLNRLRMEGNNSKADVVLGLDNNLLQAAQDTRLFSPHNVNISALMLPGGWYDTTFLPYEYGYFAFVYDKTKIKEPPKSLHELVDSTSTLKVIYEDPRTSTPGLGLLLWIQKIYGNNAQNAWQKLSKKTVTITKSWSEAYGLFLKGEADMVFSYTTSPLYHILKEDKYQYAAAIFSEGHYQQIKIAAQLKSSKQPELANKFLQFLISPDFQNTVPTNHWMYPVISFTLPAVFDQLSHQTLSFNPQQVASQRSEWIENWRLSVTTTNK